MQFPSQRAASHGPGPAPSPSQATSLAAARRPARRARRRVRQTWDRSHGLLSASEARASLSQSQRPNLRHVARLSPATVRDHIKFGASGLPETRTVTMTGGSSCVELELQFNGCQGSCDRRGLLRLSTVGTVERDRPGGVPAVTVRPVPPPAAKLLSPGRGNLN